MWIAHNLQQLEFGNGGHDFRHTTTIADLECLFGYIVGMETSLGSFACGCSVARWVHRKVNPDLAAEDDACRSKKEQGVYLNRDLPDLERRFLPAIEMPPRFSELAQPVTRMKNLARWRASTVEARRVGSPMLQVLLDVENAVFIQRKPIPTTAESAARAEGWDVDSLLEYVAEKQKYVLTSSSSSDDSVNSVAVGVTNRLEGRIWMRLPFVASLLAVVMALLVVGLALVNAKTATAVTNRTMIYAMLLAPTGALLRWKLSVWNSNCTFLPEEWKWLPAGTFATNILGSVVSIVTVALEYRLEEKSSNFDVTDF